jgi:hypothetical protein
MTNAFWTPGMSPALARAQVEEAADRAARVLAAEMLITQATARRLLDEAGEDGLAGGCGTYHCPVHCETGSPAQLPAPRPPGQQEARKAAASGTGDDLFREEPGLTAFGPDGLISAADGSRVPVTMAAPGVWVPAGGPCRCEVPFAADPAAHAPGCPRRAGPASVFPGPPPACACGPARAAETGPAPDGLAEFWAVMGEPLGLPDDQLPRYGVHPPGTCRQCFRGPVYKDGRCLYCLTLSELGKTATEPDWRDAADGGTPDFPRVGVTGDGGVQEPAGMAGRFCRCGGPGCRGLHCVWCGARPGQGHVTTCDRDAGYRDDSEPCSHGGRRQQFVRDGACRRCGTTRLTGRIPAARPPGHLRGPSRWRECEPAGRRFLGLRLIMMMTGWLLLIMAASQPGAIWLLVPGTVMAVLAYRGPRRHRGQR